MTRKTPPTTPTPIPDKPLRKRPRSRSKAAERAENKLQRLIAQNRAEKRFADNDDMFNYNQFGRLLLAVAAGGLVTLLIRAFFS